MICYTAQVTDTKERRGIGMDLVNSRLTVAVPEYPSSLGPPLLLSLRTGSAGFEILDHIPQLRGSASTEGP